MNIILFLIVLGVCCIYKMSDGKAFKNFFHPMEAGRKAAREYLERRIKK